MVYDGVVEEASTQRRHGNVTGFGARGHGDVRVLGVACKWSGRGFFVFVHIFGTIGDPTCCGDEIVRD